MCIVSLKFLFRYISLRLYEQNFSFSEHDLHNNRDKNTVVGEGFFFPDPLPNPEEDYPLNF